MFGAHLKMAMASIRANRWRSFLTMLGIIIGVASVVTIVSLGEGVKQQINGQINRLGTDLITVRAGKSVTRDSNGKIKDVNLFSAYSTNTLSEKDFITISKTKGVKVAVPFNLLAGVPRYDNKEYSPGFVVGVSAAAPEILQQKIAYGSFFSGQELSNKSAIIGQRVAEELYEENAPIGKSIKVRGENFIIRGVFDEFETNPFVPNADYNTAIFIPYDSSRELSRDNTQIYQVLVKPNDSSQTDTLAKEITQNLKNTHSGEEDFSVLQQEESLAITNKVFTLLTGLITGVAAISLVVGGIGIMNIMLVSVTECTREIGVRKAVGATNHQILSQFVAEAAVLSFSGGVFGVLVSLIANILIRILTNLQPVVTLPIMFIAVGVAMAVGLFFGMAPAYKAAKKDPIEALRFE
jgi:ABC-type antimicrobial peptide transport system permease subunit